METTEQPTVLKPTVLPQVWKQVVNLYILEINIKVGLKNDLRIVP